MAIFQNYETAYTESLNVQYKRTHDIPTDMSDIFNSYEDAVEYAKGKYKKDGDVRAKAHDERGLAGVSYIGQIITVYEEDSIHSYKIVESDDSRYKGKLERLVPIEGVYVDSEHIEPVDGAININIPKYKAGSGLEIQEDKTINVVSIDCGTF